MSLCSCVNRQSVFLTPTPLFFALTTERCRKSWGESIGDSARLGAQPGPARSASPGVEGLKNRQRRNYGRDDESVVSSSTLFSASSTLTAKRSPPRRLI